MKEYLQKFYFLIIFLIKFNVKFMMMIHDDLLHLKMQFRLFNSKIENNDMEENIDERQAHKKDKNSI